MDKFLQGLGAVVGAITVMVLWVCAEAWVLTKLWDWFVVETFHIEQLSLRVAIGLSLIPRLFSVSPYDPDETKLQRTLGKVLALPLALLIGWLVS